MTASGKYNLLVPFLLLSVFLFVLDKFWMVDFIRNPAEMAINPVKEKIAGININSQQNFSLDPAILLTKNDYLESRVASLQAVGEKLKEENDVLRSQLGVKLPNQPELIQAKNLGILAGVMTADAGEKSGVAEGAVAVLSGSLVGRVGEVTNYSCRIILPGKPNNLVKVKIVPGGDKGVLKGTPEGRLLLDEVLQEVKLEKDMLIVTAGDNDYPPDLPIGRISQVLSDDVQIYKQAEVEPLVDYSSAKIIFIRI